MSFAISKRDISEHILSFLVAKISKVVDANSVAFSLSIMGLDEVVHVCELLESELILLFGSIRSVIFGNEVDEFSFNFWEWGLEECLSSLNCVYIHNGEGGNCTSDGNCSEEFDGSHL